MSKIFNIPTRQRYSETEFLKDLLLCIQVFFFFFENSLCIQVDFRQTHHLEENTSLQNKTIHL